MNFFGMLPVIKLLLRIAGLIFLLCCVAFTGFASHLRAAEVSVEQPDCSKPLTYRITVTVYMNTTSFTVFGGNSLTDGHINFGDGSIQLIPYVPALPRPDLGENISVASYSIDHTFPQTGTFKINYYERDRNEGVINMPNSIDVPLSTYLDLHIKPSMGCNRFPKLAIPPVDRTCPGVAFFHNSGASDDDGDSLSYALTTPAFDINQYVDGYLNPNDASFYTDYATGNEAGDGPPAFFIDPVTGLITWDAPELQGEYNIAFQVIEWRRNPVTLEHEVLSVTVRDMQIVVEDCQNRRPDLIVPQDTCVEAGAVLSKQILGTDPESDPVKIEAFSELLDLSDMPATILPDSALYGPSDPASVLEFDWTTDCLHVREQPYQVVFKITDDSPSGTRLVTYKTWSIRVIAPAPEWRDVQLDLINRHAMLEWEAYPCANAEKIQVWRKVGTAGYDPGNCSSGLPGFLGYELVEELDPEQALFTDTNGGKGLVVGARYCYLLLAVFKLPQGGRSYVSEEICVGPIQIDAPLITEVSVTKTDSEAGMVRVGWWSPLEINRTQFPGPYEYEVYRAAGFTAQAAPVNISGRITDTTFMDTGVNTEEGIYNYRIVLYSNTENTSEYFPIDTSATASTVRLTGEPGEERIILDWEAEVPWSNYAVENRRHLIYRGERDTGEEALQLIDSVDVTLNGLHYVDNGTYESTPIDPNKQYCYRVVTRGSYGNDQIGILENASQMVCLYPQNDLLPCAPVVSVQGLDCDAFTQGETCRASALTNTIFWSSPAEGCRADIRWYNLYGSDSQSGEFSLIGQVRDTFYVEEGLTSLARCYRVEAVDELGRVSELSQVVCGDNCPYFELPNVFTPNGDDCNDRFSAYYDPQGGGGEEVICPVVNVIRCPRFVKQVDLMVFNRWGEQVYTFSSAREGTVYIEWDGRDNNGADLESAVYYYIANVDFDVLDPQKKNQRYKGWVHLIR